MPEGKLKFRAEYNHDDFIAFSIGLYFADEAYLSIVIWKHRISIGRMWKYE